MNLPVATIETKCPTSEIAAYVDGELTPRAEMELEAHFAGCKDCLAELNLQKQMLSALDFALDEKEDLQLPKNFAKIVATRAESGVCGLRSKDERFRALFICAFLLLFTVIGLGAETGNLVTTAGGFFERILAVVGFAGHLFFSLALGVSIILRSLSGQFVFNSVASIAIVAGLFAASALLLSRLISRGARP